MRWPFTQWLLSGAFRSRNLRLTDYIFLQAHRAFLRAKERGYEGPHPLTPAIIALQKKPYLTSEKIPHSHYATIRWQCDRSCTYRR